MRITRILCSAPAGLALLWASPSSAEQIFSFDLASNGKISLARPADGLIPLRLIYKAPTGTESFHVVATVSAPSLVGDGKANDGNPAGPEKVQPTYIAAGSCDKPPVKFEASLKDLNNWEPLCLFVKQLPPGKFTGFLLVTGSAVDPANHQTKKLEPSLTQLEISEVLPAGLSATALNVSPPPAPVKLTLPVWGFSSGTADFYATLREKGNKADVVGLAVTMDASASSTKLDRSQVATYVGLDQVDLFTSDPDRKIPTAGQQIDVRLALDQLVAGDYSVTFRFSGTNATSDDTQKFTALIHVRHHWLWPVLLILGATLISFLANKVISAKRRRAALMEKIDGLRPAWLGEFADSQPVVWVRAMLSQSENLSSRYWLTSPDTIEARVNMVANVLKVLDEARRLRDRLHDALDYLVFRRVVQSLERLVERVGAGALDDASVAKFESQLAPFEDWINKDRYPATLWGQILSEVGQMQADIAASPGEAPNLPQFLAANTALTGFLAAPPSTPAAADTAYRHLVILKILWGCRKNAATLAECANAGSDVEKLIEIVDRLDWEALEAAPLKIQFPLNDNPDGFEAFSPLTFSISAGGAPVEGTYLFRHKISVNWRIDLDAEPRRLRPTPKPVTLTPKTLGPSVMQYFPLAGVAHVSAEISYRGETRLLVSNETLVIGPSREFGIMKAFEQAEVLGWAIATVIAVASGLLIYYVPNFGWGSFKDYLTLFIWGAVGDQGRNFIQASTGIPK